MFIGQSMGADGMPVGWHRLAIHLTEPEAQVLRDLLARVTEPDERGESMLDRFKDREMFDKADQLLGYLRRWGL